MSEKRKRRQWKPEEKLRIVLAGMDPGVKVSELCRREGIQPTQYHTWKQPTAKSALKRSSATRSRSRREAAQRGSARRAVASERRGDRRDHGREPGAKKNALGLEDYGQLASGTSSSKWSPTVDQAKTRSQYANRHVFESTSESNVRRISAGSGRSVGTKQRREPTPPTFRPTKLYPRRSRSVVDLRASGASGDSSSGDGLADGR